MTCLAFISLHGLVRFFALVFISFLALALETVHLQLFVKAFGIGLIVQGSWHVSKVLAACSLVFSPLREPSTINETAISDAHSLA